MHVDDYIDSPDADPVAREFLDHARRPAILKDIQWMHANRPLVTWRGGTWMVVGASRLGDVWLRQVGGPEQPYYEHRVDVAELSDWRRPASREGGG